MVKVGIPRALLYYQYYPMWRAFFESLGAEVITSPETTQAVYAAGASRVVAETCLPVKVFIGHVIYLSDKCDFIFVPAVRSIEKKVINCSKFLGLPDLARAVVPEARRILDIDVDADKGKLCLYHNIYKLGSYFSRNPLKIKRAALSAFKVLDEYQELIQREELKPPEAIDRMNKEIQPQSEKSAKRTIALIGHPYMLYDSFVNHRLIPRLEKLGCRVVTPEMVSRENLNEGVARVSGKPYWTYEAEVSGAGGHFLKSAISGVIGIMPFGCGPDSMMMDLVRRRAKSPGSVPFMSLTLEEHTSESGIITRLEAFLDMIARRQEAERCG